MKLTPAIISQVDAKNLTEIKALNFSGKEVSHVDDISVCVNLHKLDLSHNSLKSDDSISGLKYCKEITWLNLAHNSFESVQVLSNLKKLTVLNMSYNQVSSLNENICSMDSLKALILNNNQLVATNLTRYPKNLNTLVLSHNKLESLGQVSYLHSLEKLSASHNSIRSIPNLSRNACLKDLKLNDNKILALTEVQLPPSLEILDLGNNLIQYLSDIGPLFQLQKLHSLNLKGNPLCKLENYREQILARCKNLRILDGERFDPKYMQKKSRKIQRESKKIKLSSSAGAK